jgi:hypothetical protein
MPLTIDEASRLISKSKKTLYRWRAAGVDISDETALRRYNAEMDLASKGATHSRALSRLSSTGPSEASAGVATEIEELPAAGQPGAVQALGRLQRLEVAFEQRLQAALAAKNAKLIQSARQDYAKISESLLRYEREIEEAKRYLGQLIPKADAVDGARASAMWLRLTVLSFISSYLPDLIAHSDPREAKAFFLDKFSEALRVTFMNARESSLKLPEWGETVIREEFRCE